MQASIITTTYNLRC